VLGSAGALSQSQSVRDSLDSLQTELFEAGADLATLSSNRRKLRRIQEDDWRRIERLIDEFQARLPPLKHFILPAGSPAACMLHQARSVCRRAERLICKLDVEEGDVNRDLVIYVNRLSDLLFVMARFENLEGGSKEVIWNPK
jgi:cob(I)alamin adenosyltransferase